MQNLARLDGGSVWLDDGLHVVSLSSIADPGRLVRVLRETGRVDRAALGGSAVKVDVTFLATAQRDLRALATNEARSLAREHKKALARHGSIDEAWLTAKATRLDALTRELSRGATEGWFERVLEIAAALHGSAHASLLRAAAVRLTALGPERQRRARAAVEALARAIEGDPPPADLAPLAERLERARELPGRARRTRALDVLRAAIGWKEAPADHAAVRALGDRASQAGFADAIRRAGGALAHALPAARDAGAQGAALEVLALAGLRFRVGADGVPLLGDEDVARAVRNQGNLADLDGIDLTFAQALALAAIPASSRYPRRRIARVVAKGLELELVQGVIDAGQLDGLVQAAGDVRSARAFATWATRLVPHYKALGIPLTLSPELFANLPKNEDLGVLAYCLVEADRRAGAAGSDPMAVLDATLGLFQKLPARASGIVARLRGTTPGAGRQAFPDLAAWLEDDALLDRYVHLAHLAGTPVPLSKRLREDFDHAEKAGRERAHLEALDPRHARQEARLRALRARDRSLAAAPRERTRRRIAERIEALLPAAYRRELDATFRSILDDAWDIRVPQLTPAWRDAVRFWLVVDDNRELLGRLLRAAAASPGRDVKRRFPKNVEWLEKATFRVDAWMRPRREPLPGGMVLELEEDPLEVLRMGMPFGTCLALDTGFNAASTVVNAVDANKRVLYVRSRDGKVLARKLLAVTPDGKLVGYHLYVSVSGDDERTIRDAVLRFCRAIGEETGLPLARTGKEPERLHGEFWYDDGTEPFDDEVNVAGYCRALGLVPPAKPDDDLEREARGQAAIGRGDVERALEALMTWGEGLANRRLGRWCVEKLGRREAIRRADEHGLTMALLEARDEPSLIDALATATRLPEGSASYVIASHLAAFPPSERLAMAVVRTLRTKADEAHERGLAHMTFTSLPRLLDGVAPSLALLDEVDAMWARIVRASPSCAGCRQTAEDLVAEAVLRIDARAPDDDAVVQCLRSGRPSDLAARAALRVAASRALPGGLAAIERVRVNRRALRDHPDAIAAYVRQAGAVPDGLEPAAAPPYEALGELLFDVPDVARVLPAGTPAIATWNPGAWELAWRRRNPDPRLLRALRDAKTNRTRELLAILGEDGGPVARAIEAQLTAWRDKKLPRLPDGATHVDAALVARALDTLRRRRGDRTLALAIVGKARHAWGPWTRDLALDDRRALLALLPPPKWTADIVDLWSEPDLRAPTAAALVGEPGAAVLAAERGGATGVFEAWAEATLAKGLVPAGAPDHLHTILEVAMRAPARGAAELYKSLPDAASAALFLGMARKAGVLDAIRAAAAGLDWKDDGSAQMKAWLETSPSPLQKRRSSSIERE